MGWRQLPLLSVFFVFLSTQAFAYPTPVDFDGSLLRWQIDETSGPITYEVLADDDAYLSQYGDIVDDAALMWSEIPTSYFRYARADESKPAQVTVNLRSSIEGGAYSAGYAIFDEYADIVPLHCSIFVVIDEYVTHASMEKTILHELGHCLGLGHTLIPQAIMSYRLEENGYALDVDDRAAVTHLYPVDGSEPELPPGCAIGAKPRDASSLPLLLLLVLPLILGARSRRRYKLALSGSEVSDHSEALPARSNKRMRP